MILNTQLVIETSIAALLVIFGVVIKNSFEQLGMPNHPIGKPLGMMLFVGGWVYTAYILSKHKQNKLAFIIPSVGITLAVIIMKHYMAQKKAPPMIAPLIFAGSWIVLGLMVSNHLTGVLKYSGLLASFLVLISMMKILPFQRKNNIIDGPGLPLFVIAWTLIIFINSNR
tara:strand:+ start:2611 stop:3120 length:510 start_codon:yes stop_codon:yes gene_type:complete